MELNNELIKNGGLENNGQNWGHTGDGTFTDYKDIDFPSGKWCGLLPSNSQNASIYQTVTLQKNTDYVLKAKVQLAKHGQTATMAVKTPDLSGFPEGMKKAEMTIECNQDQEWKWQDVELKFNSGEATKVSVAVMKWTESTDDEIYKGQVYVDDISLKPVHEQASDYEMIWADDFNQNQLDTSKWGYELGCIRGVEQEHYTNEDDNVFVKDGQLNLQITDRAKEDQYKNPRGDRQVIYDSGSIRTHGKQEFLYGRIEMKAKLPKGQGVFPAFWMLGSDFTLDGKISNEQGQPWPVCGEVDIMELTGKASDTAGSGNQTVWQTLHYGNGADKDNGKYAGNGTGWSLPEGTFNDDYHIFGLNWSKGKMEWYVDNQIVRTVDYSDDELAELTLDRPQYIQLNLAAGGNWPGDAGKDLAGKKFEVDYVYYAQNEQQKQDANEYYQNAATIDGVKNVTMYQGDIPNLLEGVTSTKETTVDFSVENEHLFKNVGGNTSVDRVCSSKDEAYKLATLPIGDYNIHYTAIPNNEELRMNPMTRRSALLTIKERRLSIDLENSGLELKGYEKDHLSDIALPEGWSWENPDQVLSIGMEAKVKFAANGFEKEETVKPIILESKTAAQLQTKVNDVTEKYIQQDEVEYTKESLDNLQKAIDHANAVLAKRAPASYAEITQAYEAIDEAVKNLVEVKPWEDLTPATPSKDETPWTDLTPSTPIKQETSWTELTPAKVKEESDKTVQTNDMTSMGMLMSTLIASSGALYALKKRKHK